MFNILRYGKSILGISAIIGSIVTGVCIGKVKINSMYIAICTLGIAILFGGVVFLFPLSEFTKYIVILIAFCFTQICACGFSVFTMSYIQQITPNNMIGKVMYYIATITLCVRPLGQILYGLLFDRFTDSVYFVLISTGTIVIIIGLFTSVFFKKLEIKNISSVHY